MIITNYQNFLEWFSHGDTNGHFFGPLIHSKDEMIVAENPKDEDHLTTEKCCCQTLESGSEEKDLKFISRLKKDDLVFEGYWARFLKRKHIVI